MRLNKYIAFHTGLSRRAADALIAEGRVHINGRDVTAGQAVAEGDTVAVDGRPIAGKAAAVQLSTVILNKPVGYVVSRNGQGSRTIYDLLPPALQLLKPVGRLDKDSSGLLLLTNDGQLAEQLTHPRYAKQKIYEVQLNAGLQPLHRQMINDYGINLPDGNSRLLLDRLQDGDDTRWIVTMSEGRNRQIRRTFAALGYDVIRLHRTHFGPYALGNLQSGRHRAV